MLLRSLGRGDGPPGPHRSRVGGNAVSNMYLGATSWWEHRKRRSDTLGGIQSRRRLKRVRAESEGILNI